MKKGKKTKVKKEEVKENYNNPGISEKESEENFIKTKKPLTRSKRKKAIQDIREKMQVIGRIEDVYKTVDGDVMDILKINGTPGVAKFTNSEIKRLIDDYKGGIRTLVKPVNFLILDFLINHQKQIDHYEYKRDQLSDKEKEVRQHEWWIEQDIASLKYRQQHRTQQQYFCVIFGENMTEVNAIRDTVLNMPRLNTETLPVNYKDALITKINNLNSTISIEGG